MTRRTPPPSRRGPRPVYIPTLTREEIMAIPVVPDNVINRNQYQITEAGKAYLEKYTKEGK